MATTAKEVKEEIVKPIDPWKDMVTVYVPKDSSSDEDSIFVSVNDHNFQVMKNMDVSVPRPVAAVLAQRQAAIRVSEITEARAREAFLKMP